MAGHAAARETEDVVLVHCLTLTFGDAATAAEIATLRDALAALPDQVDVPMSTRLGPDLGDRPGNADFAVVSEFAGVDDFYRYLRHPAHQALPVGPVSAMSSVQFVVD
jgi:hypothetical protein